jgi:hypothetical protein
MTVHEVEELIRAAFPDEPFTGAVTSRCTCEECTDLATSLRGQSWSTVSDGTMKVQFGGLPLLSDAAQVAFLPAWLMRSLSADLDLSRRSIREWALYHLALYWDSKTGDASRHAKEAERLRQLYGNFSVDQALAVEQWLKFIREQADLTHWEREPIDGALGILDQILGRT